jgi:ABC-2 type transport system ATP-binding protein
VYLDLSVAENLAFVARAHRMERARTLERTHSLLERAGLAGFENRLAGQLSGGMRQKLGLIRVLLPEPDLLVLDEPTTGIDPVSRRALWAIVARAAADGAAVVVSTSYLDEAERAAHILVLDRGRPLAAGTREDILRRTPGTLTAASAPPTGHLGALAWRRGARWRIWWPDGVAAADYAGQIVVPDLQDAVTIAALQHEAEGMDL